MKLSELFPIKHYSQKSPTERFAKSVICFGSGVDVSLLGDGTTFDGRSRINCIMVRWGCEACGRAVIVTFLASGDMIDCRGERVPEMAFVVCDKCAAKAPAALLGYPAWEPAGLP